MNKFWYLKGMGLLAKATVENDGSLSNLQIYRHSNKKWIADKDQELFKCLNSNTNFICAEPLNDTHEIQDLEQIDKIALRFAEDAHEGQIDEDSVPFINHPINVAARLNTPLEKAIAYLHDVVEDTNYTVEDVKRAFGTEVSDRIDLLTYDEECDYIDGYIWKLANDPVATRVKLADLSHNLERDYSHKPEKRNLARIRKHEEAVIILTKYGDLYQKDSVELK